MTQTKTIVTALFFSLFTIALLMPGVAKAQSAESLKERPDSQIVEMHRNNLITGDKLLKLCKSEVKTDLRNCDVYIAAVVDYHNLIKGLGNPPSIDFCLTPRDTNLQRRAVIVNYLEANPEQYEFIAAPAIAMAFNLKYPCTN